MIIGFETCYSVVNCKHEYRINLFNKRPKIRVNTIACILNSDNKEENTRVINSDDNGEVIYNEECERVALRRAKRMLVDLVMCNDFDYFGTITLDEEKVGDLITYPQKMKDWITSVFSNYRECYAPDFRYILIAEYGKKTQRLHFHFICKGIRKEDLFYNSHRKLDWHLTSDRFGFTQIARIKGTNLDRVRVARYCAKYLSKDALKICKHRYFASKDLKRPERTVSEDDEKALLIVEWLETHCFTPYCDMEYAKCYSIPALVYNDLMKYLEDIRRSKLPYLIPLPDDVISPWDWNFNPKQLHYKEVLV